MRGIKKFIKRYVFNIFLKCENILSKKNFFYKHKYKICLFGLLTFLFILLIFSLNKVSASRIELLSFKQELKKNELCHEECRRFRQQQKEKIATDLSSDKLLLDDFKKYFLLAASQGDDSSRFIWQELLQISALSSSADYLLDFFIDYLVSEEGSDLVKADIIRFLLVDIDDINLIRYYFALLQSSSSDALKIEAIRALSLAKPKELFFQREQLNILKSLILQSNSNPSLKMDTLFLLNDYFSFFPEEVKSIFLDIYYRTEDIPLQIMTATFLNSLDEINLSFPIIDDNEWLPYF